jgi:hypothetical protein
MWQFPYYDQPEEKITTVRVSKRSGRYIFTTKRFKGLMLVPVCQTCRLAGEFFANTREGLIDLALSKGWRVTKKNKLMCADCIGKQVQQFSQAKQNKLTK